ncbi:Queuine tRNA-ribosyltransferase subunit qtrtd1 [Blastocladiella emersonii ATCC 22665]|nr:Queuine tRNA-ribosyltransferase subunit qtrtd1 [Blastocladiella emersonii ATCC 22665]
MTSRRDLQDLPVDNDGPATLVGAAPPALHAAPVATMATVSFRHRLVGALRRGTLTLERTAIAAPASSPETLPPASATPSPALSATIETPGLAVYTRRLVVPHMTHDTLALAKPAPALMDLPLESSMNALPATYPGTLRSLANLHDAFTLFTGRDAAAAMDKNAAHGKDFVHVRTERGLGKLTADGFADLVKKWNPDVAAAPAAVLAGEVSDKVASRAVDRTLGMLDKSLPLLPASTPVFATVTGTSPATLDKCAAHIASRPRIAGYVLDAPRLASGADLTPALAALDPAKPRYAASLLTPDAMARNLGAADMFSSAFAYSLASHGYALHLSLHDGENAIHNLASGEFRTDTTPLLTGCECWACAKHTRAYVFHLLDCHEMLGWTLLAIHNVHQLDAFLASIRAAIDTNVGAAAQAAVDAWLARYERDVGPEQKRIVDEVLGLGLPTATAAKAATEKPQLKRPRSTDSAAAAESEKKTKKQKTGSSE